MNLALAGDKLVQKCGAKLSSKMIIWHTDSLKRTVASKAVLAAAVIQNEMRMIWHGPIERKCRESGPRSFDVIMADEGTNWGEPLMTKQQMSLPRAEPDISQAT
jgi:hypothetical protein